jgi:hypothetical protein
MTPGMNGVFKLALCLVLAAGLALVPGSAPAEEDGESSVKSSMLVKILSFVDWGKADKSPAELALCIIGKDPFGRTLEPVRGKLIQGRKLTLSRPAGPDTLKGCNAVFVSGSEAGRLEQITGASRKNRILTVSDSDGFAGRGIMLNMVRIDGKLKLEANLEEASASKVGISSKLIRLAHPVATAAQDKK